MCSHARCPTLTMLSCALHNHLCACKLNAPSLRFWLVCYVPCILQPYVAAAAAHAAHAGPGSPSPELSRCAPLLAFDEGLLRHAPPADSSHPERPERAAAVMARLVATGLAGRCRRVRAGGQGQPVHSACFAGVPTACVAASVSGSTTSHTIGFGLLCSELRSEVRPMPFVWPTSSAQSCSAGCAVPCSLITVLCPAAACLFRSHAVWRVWRSCPRCMTWR
jgi:hypothetical protein